jgi:membrane associated rhomboid family serine protease
MFPLRAVHKTVKPPWITRLLVLANVLAFCFQALPWERDVLVAEMGVKPQCYFSPGSCGISVPGETQLLWQPLFASLFLHGGLLHLAFNMLFLWVFGPGLEERLGKFKFLGFYLACGLVAGVGHIITNPFSMSPAIGASGAISGVLGAYLILLPRSWILTYFPPIFLFPLPAPLFLILWMLSQVLSFFTNLPWLGGGHSDIAWMAHIAGFVCGALWGWSIKPWWKKKKADARSS